MEKPVVKLIGQDGNVFNLIGLTIRALKKAGQSEQSKEFSAKAFGCASYGEVLNLIQEYADVE